MKNKLDIDKIKINWNKNPIKMYQFLSFLKVKLEKSTGFLGETNGWTQRINKDWNLRVGGGIVGGIEWLDSIQFRKNMMNKYNDYVNPFYLFEIMNDEGKAFFIDYYKADIEEIILKQKRKVELLKNSLENEKRTLKEYEIFTKTLKSNKIQPIGGNDEI